MRRALLTSRIAAIALFAISCDDALFPSHTDPSTAGGGEGWCGVQALVQSNCLSCHSAAARFGELDLETDLYAALVEAPATLGGTRVIPGDPDGSLLIRKLTGELGNSEGGVMPPNGILDATRIEIVRAWIEAGADDVCTDPVDGTGSGRYHPTDWPDPAVHGLGAKLQTETDCRTCHGAELEGAAGPACASCHPAGWETDCTFCHGDPARNQPAPPRDIDDDQNPSTISFPPHRLHLDSPLHTPWSCEQCHIVPDSALSGGHLFDDTTPGRAEIRFGDLAQGGSYSGGSCNVYCHIGQVSIGDAAACGSCHPTAQTPGRWDELPGPHERHLDEGIRCAECHPDVSADGSTLLDATRHVDGSPTLSLPSQMDYDGTCTGVCHEEAHSGRRWVE